MVFLENLFEEIKEKYQKKKYALHIPDKLFLYVYNPFISQSKRKIILDGIIMDFDGIMIILYDKKISIEI
ncbi:MAG: hypothetical protein QXI77_03475 [Nanopusillaceae archaeon]